MANGLKLEGQRFGHLTVLKKLDERENRYVVWLCRCDCGNEIKVNTRHLMRGTVKDCGCIPENSAKRGPVAEDLTGRRFGKLVAVKKLESKNGRTRWECRCDCGNMHISTAHSLKMYQLRLRPLCQRSRDHRHQRTAFRAADCSLSYR